MSFLEPRIDLVDRVSVRVSAPTITKTKCIVWDGEFRFDKIGWVFEDVDVESTTDVPCDVAMERPDAWVVGFDLKDHVA